jgi:hypothetical protein
LSSALDSFTKFVNSPGGVIAAGAVLAGIVWKFFERVEAVLAEQTKFEIAVWLVGVEIGQRIEPWPETFAKMFDRVFGKQHLSWACFWRSVIYSYALAICGLLLAFHEQKQHLSRKFTFGFILTAMISNAVPDYLSLLKNRLILGFMIRRVNGLVWIAGIVVDALVTIYISAACAIFSLYLWVSLLGLRDRVPLIWRTMINVLTVDTFTASGRGHFISGWLSIASQYPYVVYPAFFSSIWLWLYAGSGFLLKASRRFDLGFDWFNRKFDIEKKPLQSIGLIAGAIVAVVYWAVVGISRVL